MVQPPPWKKTSAGSATLSPTPAGRTMRKAMSPAGPGTVISRTRPTAGGSGWVKLRLDDGTKGWTRADDVFALDR